MLAACSDSTQDGAGEAGKTVYRHSMDGVPRGLDPAQASSIYAKMLVVNLYDTLYRYKYLARPYELKPRLAVDLLEVSEDGRSVKLGFAASYVDAVRIYVADPTE